MDGDGKLDDVGYYRFEWEGQPLSLQTGSGTTFITGPESLVLGPRNLMIYLKPKPPESIALVEDFPADGYVLAMPDSSALEFRDSQGKVLLQRVTDPASDGLFAINLDVLALDRLEGPEDQVTYILRVRGRRAIQLESKYEAWELKLGEVRYQYQVYPNDARASIKVEAGIVGPWDGPITFGDKVVEWVLPAETELSFSARTLRSNIPGDETGTFSALPFQRMFGAGIAACGA